MKDNASSINGTLKINPYVIENNGDENTEYFSSDFKNEDGSLNDVAMRQNSLDVGEQVASEGMAVLFNKNNALPLNEGSKVSLFGIGSVNFATGSSGGSGGVAATIDKDFKQTLETSTSEGGAGFEVNNKLWDFIKIMHTLMVKDMVAGECLVDLAVKIQDIIKIHIIENFLFVKLLGIKLLKV